MYCLEVVSDAPRGAASYYSLCVRQPYVVGRSDTCDITLNTQSVSRLHGTLQVVRASNVEYSYSRGGATPYRPPVGSPGGRSGGTPPKEEERAASPTLEASLNRAPQDSFALPLADRLDAVADPPHHRKTDAASEASPQPGNEQQQDADDNAAAPPLALVVTNQSKFGTYVDGAVITGSCVVPNGGIVCFGSVGFRATYRPLVVSLNPEVYDDSHRSELEDMLVQLGALISARPGDETAELATIAAAAERHAKRSLFALGALEPPRSSNPSEIPPPSSTGGDHPRSEAGWTTPQPAATPTGTGHGDVFDTSIGSLQLPARKAAKVAPVRPLGCFYLTDVIDASDTTVDALLHGHSMVLPAFVFELFAALADRCSKPLHTLPKPSDYEPPKSVEVYSGTTYLRPEPRTMPFSLFAPSGHHVSTASRSTLLQHRMFTIHNEALRDKLAPVLQACGAAVIPWEGALSFTKYDVHGDEDPNELPRDPDEEDYYEAVGLGRGDGGSPSVADARHFRSRRAMLQRFRDRRYAIATRGEIIALRDEAITHEPPPAAPEAEHDVYRRVTALREDWFLMAKNEWAVVGHECILRALLCNTFVPMPELPSDSDKFNDPVPPSVASSELLEADAGGDDVFATPMKTETIGARSSPGGPGGDMDSDATPSELGSEGDGPVRAALRKLAVDQDTSGQKLASFMLSSPRSAGGAAAGDVTKHLSSAARTVHNPQHFPPSAAEEGGPAGGAKGGAGVEAWVAAQRATSASAGARSAQAFDIRMHRLQVVVDRTIVVCKQRIDEIMAAYGGQRAGVTSRNAALQYSAPSAIQTLRTGTNGPQMRQKPAPAQTLAFLRNIVNKTSAHLASLEDLSAAPEGQLRAVGIQQQWDIVDGVRSAALAAIDAVVRQATPDVVAEHTAAAEALGGHPGMHAGTFRGRTTTADRHVMPAFDGRDSQSPKQPRRSSSVRSSAASTARSASTMLTASSQVTSAVSVAGSHHHAASVGGGAPGGAAPRRAKTPTRTTTTGSGSATLQRVAPAPASARGLRDRTRWARYHPAAPVHALSTPTQGGGGKATGYNALQAKVAPMDLPRISRHRRLFFTKYGPQEGEVRFNMWLSSQSPQWTAAFFHALEEKELTLGEFLRNSV